MVSESWEVGPFVNNKGEDTMLVIGDKFCKFSSSPYNKSSVMARRQVQAHSRKCTPWILRKTMPKFQCQLRPKILWFAPVIWNLFCYMTTLEFVRDFVRNLLQRNVEYRLSSWLIFIHSRKILELCSPGLYRPAEILWTPMEWPTFLHGVFGTCMVRGSAVHLRIGSPASTAHTVPAVLT